jgi:hypothetical protein
MGPSIHSNCQVPSGKWLFAFLAVVTAVMTIAVFLVQGKVGFTLWDDSFLWYGAQRVLLGEIPIRDFQAYDPGRYYWCAAFMSIMGNNGIIALRPAMFAFEAIGIFLGLVALVRSWDRPDFVSVFLALLILMLWMFMPFKTFDISISLALLASLAYLFENPSGRRFFILGITVGLAAMIGRNHGLYGTVASLGAIVYLVLFTTHGRLFSALFWWASGVFAGYLPMIIMMAAVPGFFGAMWESVRMLFECRTTNLTLPIPWPWRMPTGLVPIKYLLVNKAIGVIVGFIFIALPAFGVAGLAWTVYRGIKHKSIPPAAAASAFLALPYAHYAFSRADVAHLSFGIAPLIIGILSIASAKSVKARITAASVLFCLTLAVTISFQPRVRAITERWPKVSIGGTQTRVDPSTAQNMSLLQSLVNKYCEPDRSFLVMPFWPGAYAAFQRRSPMWQIYVGLCPGCDTFQQTEIERIREANPGFILISNIPLDGREDMRFKNSHRLIYQYLKENYELVNEPLAQPMMMIFKGRP